MSLRWFTKNAQELFINVYKDEQEVYCGDGMHCDIDGEIKEISLHKGRLIIILVS